MPLNSFADIGLTESLLRALARERLVEPTPIQAGAIPPLLAGRDLLGIAQTGTGKTAAFALPLLQHLITAPVRSAHFATRALILAPTRELALQIEDSLRRFANQQALRIVAILGGVSRFMQVQRMRGGADIVVGTPGRICDLMVGGELKLDQVSQFVLDEADRMLDLGFIRDIRRIIAALPVKRQSALFSATMPPEGAALAETLLHNPLRVDVARNAPAALPIEQHVHFVEAAGKRTLLGCLLAAPALSRVAIGAGYHRYFSHRAFSTSRFCQFVLAFLAQTSAQRGILWWASKHHRYSDTEDDVHSPVQRGFLYAHLGWIFVPSNDPTDFAAVHDLARYKELMWLDQHPYLPAALLASATWLLAGWPGLVIGFCWSTVAVWHATFCINSLAHVVGRQRYVAGDQSRNNWLLAVLTMGEG